MSINESVVKSYLQKIVEPPLQLFSISVKTASGHFLIEVTLDNTNDPRGSVSIIDCENVSRLLTNYLEESFSNENYTLQVSSAGAERGLRLPDDLHRFKKIPVKIFYLDNGKKISKVFEILESNQDSVILKPLEKKDVKLLGQNFELKIQNITKGNLFLKI